MAPRAAWLLLLALPALVLPAPAPSPQDAGGGGEGGTAAAGALAALGLLAALAALLLGCTWCQRYKNCKLFGAGARRPSARAVEAPPPEPEPAAGAEPERGPVYLVRADNNNAPEDNNNGPISLRELQNIENNNAAVYIVSENENRNALARRRASGAGGAAGASRESVVEFEPLPADITPSRRPQPARPPHLDPQLADWFAPPFDDFPRNRLQYLREIGRGSFGRVVAGEVVGAAAGGGARAVAVRILERDAPADARVGFLRSARALRSARHDNVLALLAGNLREEPWLLVYELCDMDLQQYLATNRPKMGALNERGVPLRLQCGAAAGLAHLHSLGHVYGSMWSGGVLVSGAEGEARARLGHYGDARARVAPPWTAPEMLAHPTLEESANSEVWSLGVVLWEVCAWGELPADAAPPPEPPLPCVYRDHLYQVMQLCWNTRPERRPSAAQVHALLDHLLTSHLSNQRPRRDDDNVASDFEDRWQRLKPNSIPKVDEHVAIIHAAAHPLGSRLSRSDEDFREAAPSNLLTVEPEAVTSRSSSIISDTLHVHKSDSLTNLHGSFEDIRNVNYLGLSDGTVLESHLESTVENKTFEVQNGPGQCEDMVERVDPWLKDIMVQGEDPSYYRDVSDVIKSLDNILNAEKTSSSESSHQASPSREQLALQVRAECLALAPSSLVKSPGITDFQSILNLPPESPMDLGEESEEVGNRGVGGALQHSFERTSEKSTPDEENFENILLTDTHSAADAHTKREVISDSADKHGDNKLVPTLKDLCAVRVNSSVSSTRKDQLESETKDCQESCDNDKLFNQLEICSVKSESVVTVIEPSDDLNKLKNVTIESKSALRDMQPEIIIQSVENTAKPAVELDEPEIIDYKMQLDINYSHQDKSGEIEEESNKNSISDTEVLSVDNDSTVYMDLKETKTGSNIEASTSSLNKGVEKDITKLCNDLKKENEDAEISRDGVDIINDSTRYLDLPQVLKETSAFLHAEKIFSIPEITLFLTNQSELSLKSPPCNLDLKENMLITSTPKVVDCKTIDTSSSEDTMEVQNESQISNEMEAPDYGPGVILTKLEQQTVPQDFSSPKYVEPPEQTEESSVVLGPFENCTLDYFTGIKTETPEQVSLETESMTEELLAFSSNFVELNLDSENVNSKAEPSQDKAPENDIENISWKDTIKPSFSPTTPPNSPGNLLLCSPRHKYLIQDYDPAPTASHSSLYQPNPMSPENGNGIDINHIDIQITTKLAMAENENNLNIEYSGPLSIEELPVPEDLEPMEMEEVGVTTPPECDEVPHSGSQENSYREGYGLDEECVRALRNELELKLPLAQASVCEVVEECPLELPPPPAGAEADSGAAEAEEARGQLVLCYPGALSPILEETDPQLSAYHSNLTWNVSHRTDSSESYPEPCNNSTDEITDLVTAMRSVQKDHDMSNDSQGSPGSKTFTIHKGDDVSKEMSMSADSLNDDGTLKDIIMPSTSANIPGPLAQCDSPGLKEEITSPINAECERISQVSPYLLSPTADSSKIHTESNENASNVSKLSKPTLPSGKSSKASDTQCLSKGTSIDSWCSNDTLFNVEDNFDELVMDSDVETDGEDRGHSSATLTREDRTKSKDGETYIIHDSKSDKCDSFTPDSITANYTYTKVNTQPMECVENHSERQTKQLALIPVVSSGDDGIICHSLTDANESRREGSLHVEQVRRSPLDLDFNVTSPTIIDTSTKEDYNLVDNQKRLAPVMSKMDSVEITCLKENLNEIIHHNNPDVQAKKLADPTQETSPLNNGVGTTTSPERHYRGMANSVTSTPLFTELKSDEPVLQESQPVVFKTPQTIYESVPDFDTFVNSAELRPQDMSPHVPDNNEAIPAKDVIKNNKSSLLNGSEDIYSVNSNTSENNVQLLSTEKDNSSGYTEFQSSARNKCQDMSSFNSHTDRSIVPITEDGISISADFLQFERSAQNRPQDLLFLDKVKSPIENINHLLPLAPNCSSDFSACSGELTDQHPNNVDTALKKTVNEPTYDGERNDSLVSKEPQLLQTIIKESNKCLKPVDEVLSVSLANDDLLSIVTNEDNVSTEENIPDFNLSNSNHLEDESTGCSTHVKDNMITITQQTGDVHTYIPIQSMKSGIELKNDNCPSFAVFDSSAQLKPQELSSFAHRNCSDVPNISNIDMTNQTAEFLSFERSAVAKPQDFSTVLRTTIETTPSNLTFNDTFETFDSHKTQRHLDAVGVKCENSNETDSSQDSTRDRSKNNVEFNQTTQCDEHNDSKNTTSQFENSGSVSQELIVARITDSIVDASVPFEQLTVQLSNGSLADESKPKNHEQIDSQTEHIEEIINENHQSPSNKAQAQEDLDRYESLETKNDSLVSLSEETMLNSNATNVDKEISSTASTVEESEPTTKEMDSLDNHFEIVDEVIVHSEPTDQEKLPERNTYKAKFHGSTLRNGGKYIVTEPTDDAENDHDLQIVQAIQELDQVLDENGIDIENDNLSDSISSTPSDIGERQTKDPNTVEICAVTNNFIENEKNFSEINSYLPLLSDIRFTGPSSDYMSTSFNQESPSEEASLLALECELRRAERNAEQLSSAAADRLREWESESEDSQTNSTSSGEFIWKDGEGQERCLTTTTDFDDNGGEELGSIAEGSEEEGGGGGEGGSGSEGEGSEGDEVEFVPSSWDCRAAPSKSAMKSLEQSPVHDGKKRVVFKRQKYHCVYEYPREAADDCDSLHSPFLPDYSTYAVWEALGAGGGGAAELGYGYSEAPMHLYRLPADANFSPNYGLPDEDFFISSSARPFESLGIMSTTSQFFPGLHATLKAVSSLERADSPADELPAPPSPLAVTAAPAGPTSLDFTTPDSGVEDITPVSTEEAPAEARPRLKLRAPEGSTSSSESPSPSSPCWEALGGLRHTRDKLKLDLPPSPSPLHLAPAASRHTQRVFNFLGAAARAEDAPLVMTDETPVARAPLPLAEDAGVVVPEPTFSTFGKTARAAADAAPLVLSDEAEAEAAVEAAAGAEAEAGAGSKAGVEAVRGEGTVLDSGDEDSGIESSAKTTLERGAPHHTHHAAA